MVDRWCMSGRGVVVVEVGKKTLLWASEWVGHLVQRWEAWDRVDRRQDCRCWNHHLHH